MKRILFFVYLLSHYKALGQAGDIKVKINPVKSIEFGVGSNQYVEGNLHNKVFNGLQYVLVYGQSWQKGNLSSFDVTIGNSHLKTGIENDYSSINAIISLSYSYLFEVDNSHNWDIHSGIGTRLNYNIGYYWVWDESHLYWTNFLGLHFRQRFSFETRGKCRISGNLSVPLITALSRSELERNFKMDDLSFGGLIRNWHGSPKMQFINNAFYLSSSIEFHFNKNKAFFPDLTYSFNYFDMKTSKSFNARSMNHLFGLKWIL